MAFVGKKVQWFCWSCTCYAEQCPMLMWTSLEKVGVYPTPGVLVLPSPTVPCLPGRASHRTFPAGEGTCSKLCLAIWSVVHLHRNMPLGNCPHLVAVQFKGISRSLVGRLEHWQISLCCLLTVVFPRQQENANHWPEPSPSSTGTHLPSQKICTCQHLPWTCRSAKWSRSKQGNTGGLGFSEVMEKAPDFCCPDCPDCVCSWLSHNLGGRAF